MLAAADLRRDLDAERAKAAALGCALAVQTAEAQRLSSAVPASSSRVMPPTAQVRFAVVRRGSEHVRLDISSWPAPQVSRPTPNVRHGCLGLRAISHLSLRRDLGSSIPVRLQQRSSVQWLLSRGDNVHSLI